MLPRSTPASRHATPICARPISSTPRSSPKITFRSTRIEGSADRGRIVGDLTIRGVTREVVLDAVFQGRQRDPWGSERAGFSAETVIDRRDFGLTWNQALEAGAVMVANDVRNLDRARGRSPRVKGGRNHVDEPAGDARPAAHDHGMTMAAADSGHAAGHDRHAGHSVAMFRDKFWLSLALTIPVVLWSARHPGVVRLHGPGVPGLGATCRAILGTIVFLYGGLVFLRGAQGELRDRQPGMMTLISLAIIVAFVTSWAGTLGLFEVEIWWELATLITIMLLGHWLEMRSIAQAQGALAALAELLPDTAERVTDGGDRDGPARGARASATSSSSGPAPGCRPTASSSTATADVDESMITGESQAVAKAAGRHGRRRHRRGRRQPARPGHGRRRGRPRCRGSCGWSPRPRRRRRGRRPWPTGPRRSCSTSPSRPARSRSSSGGCRAIPRARSSGPRRCSSSPARTRSAWRSRW